MQNIQVTITGNGENYVLRKADNRYYVEDQEIIQTPLKDLEEEDKENYKESRDSGYSKQEDFLLQTSSEIQEKGLQISMVI
jgi:hypothetical protein